MQARQGAPYTVFGSPWSRSCPEGYSREAAFGQIAEFLSLAGEEAAPYQVVIAIEHNNRGETNMLNHFSDGVRMARTVDHPNVRVLCDYYHLRFEGDSPSVLLDGGSELLIHTHISQLEGRRYPTDLSLEPMLPEYAGVLRQIGYAGGVSVESKVDAPEHWEEQAALALANLRQVLG